MTKALEEMSVDELDEYKAGINAEIDARRTLLAEANVHRARAIALATAQAALVAAGVDGAVTISPAPAPVGVVGQEVQ